MFPNSHSSELQYSRSPFEFPSKYYESYQENGTKYLKSLKSLPKNVQDQLDACEGEIFLSGIPPEMRAEQIAEIAALLGELYILRFKVNFSGNSRGFAYLQYLNVSLMPLALARLPLLFRQNSLPMIRVRESRNSSKLLLKKTYRMSPQAVYELLSNVIKFRKLIGREIFPGHFEYQIVFKCNEEAVHGRRELLRSITKFGRNAIVVWDTSMEVVDPKFGWTQQPLPPQRQQVTAQQQSLQQLQPSLQQQEVAKILPEEQRSLQLQLQSQQNFLTSSSSISSLAKDFLALSV